MNVLKNFKKSLLLPPKIAISKAFDKLFEGRLSKQIFEKYTQMDFFILTNLQNHALNHYFQINNVDEVRKYSNDILFLSEKYLEHEFNYLAQNWYRVNLKIGDTEKSDENNISTLKYTSKKIIQNNEIGISSWIEDNIIDSYKQVSRRAVSQISKGHKMIDWQCDFITGYRWSETMWNKEIIYGNKKGVDIKVPWELGRMQHLPVLGLAAYLSSNSVEKFKKSDVYYIEFKNQVLDFIAMNPVGLGVQWMNPMDAALRAISWLVGYDFFYSAGFTFDNEFESLFVWSLNNHCRFILDNLEWSSGMRGNHYLINIAGLIFISSYLPLSDETTLWLALGIQELINEVLYQFNEDGSNFEASANYHYFSADTVFFSLYILLSLDAGKLDALTYLKSNLQMNKRKLLKYDNQLFRVDKISGKIIFPDSFIKRIFKLIEFSMYIKSGNTSPLQIGDNDSGRFIKLIPSTKSYHHFHLAEMIFKKDINYGNKENLFFSQVLKHPKNQILNIDLEHIINDYKIFSKGIFSDTKKIHLKKFPDFGLYVFNSGNYRLFFRCGSVGQKGKGGHSHNDQLSIYLTINNESIFVDAGTYTYTSDYHLRNLYRSTKMHNTLSIEGMEQNDWDVESTDDLFWIKREKSKAKILKLSYNYIEAAHYGFDKPHIRKIKLDERAFEIEDYCNSKRHKVIRFHLHPDVKIIDSGKNKIILMQDDNSLRVEFNKAEFEIKEFLFSPEYGIQVGSKVIVATLEENFVNTKISIL